MTRVRRPLSAAALLLAVLCAPAAAADQAAEQEARALFKKGTALLEQGNYIEALDR